jgi:uncharacterized protein YqjF (DUF2071 family)
LPRRFSLRADGGGALPQPESGTVVGDRPSSAGPAAVWVLTRRLCVCLPIRRICPEVIRDFLTTPARQTGTLGQRAHRPWRLPRTPWLMGQTWLDLLFAHWPLAPAALEPLVPHPLTLDTYDGRAWIGVTPFVLSGLRLAPTPPMPYFSTFPEVNVRTYASLGGKPGIYFFSLDAASRVAVATARRFYRLPYFLAEMDATKSGGRMAYRSKRTDERGHEAELVMRYRPSGPVAVAQPGSLEHFLAERYCLYTINEQGQPLRAEIHHPPWPLQHAEAEIDLNTMVPPGIRLADVAPLLHFAARQDVLIWPPAKV